MKRILYIGLAVFALGMVSCSKQDVQPNSTSDTVVPVWKSLDTNSDGTNNPSSSEGGSGITDPNNDPELESSGS